tara:strand:- start:418 stop:1470 length:1053 start_codon:yes stop_codon:yes gene_type:complete
MAAEFPEEQVNKSRVIEADSGSVIGTNFNKEKSVLKYPLDLESANGHYMIFNIHARTDSPSDLPSADVNIANDNLGTYNDTFTSERFFDSGGSVNVPKFGEIKAGKNIQMIKDTIVMYMPDDVNVTYKANYEAADIGLAVAAGASIGDLLKGNTGGGDMAKGLGLQFAKFIEPVLNFGSLTTAQGLNALIQRKTGLATQPMAEMMFSGIDFRTFSYSFTMTPRSREEAREVKNILDCFTFHMLPEKLGKGAPLAFRVPSEFTIRYMYRGAENNYLNHLTFCALTNMKIDYGGGERYQTFRPDETGAPPIQTKVSLEFQELELIDKRRFNNTHGLRARRIEDFSDDKFGLL